MHIFVWRISVFAGSSSRGNRPFLTISLFKLHFLLVRCTISAVPLNFPNFLMLKISCGWKGAASRAVSIFPRHGEPYRSLTPGNHGGCRGWKHVILWDEGVCFILLGSNYIAGYTTTGWWFQTWLDYFPFHIWDNYPSHWLIFFKMGTLHHQPDLIMNHIYQPMVCHTWYPIASILLVIPLPSGKLT